MMGLLEAVKGMGYNPMVTEELRAGIHSLFNVEFINKPDFNNGRYILAPNHVSDFDAPILGILHPKIRVVSKTDWTENEKLSSFLRLHYDLYGLDRTSLQSLRNLLSDSAAYFNDNADNRHFLVFCQGTISDFNNNGLERISPIAQKISDKTDVHIVNVYVEQVSFTRPTRIVFDEPMKPARQDDFRRIWLERLRMMQDSLDPPARRPNLTEKHANNNRPGDPYF
jgi:hypothetical protein